MNNSTITIGICNEVLNASDGWQQALAIIKGSWIPIIIAFLIPLFFVLLVGWLTKSISKVNFWVVWFSLAFAEVITIIIFIFMITI